MKKNGFDLKARVKLLERANLQLLDQVMSKIFVKALILIGAVWLAVVTYKLLP